MTDRVPSTFLLVPGPWASTDAIVAALARGGIDASPISESGVTSGEVRVDCVEEGNGFGAAMRHGRSGPVAADVVVSAGRCTHAALVELGFRFHEDVPRILTVARALRATGGVGVRVEASGSASAWDPWFAALESGDAFGLVGATVIVVRDRGGVFFTCGMHAFDLPEAQIETSSDDEAFAWLDTLCAFQIGERPVLATGHTFRPDATTERRRLQRWPDHRHDPGDGRHNPFGVWRLVPDTADALAAVNPVLVCMPSLVSLLVAAEREAERHLRRDEVEALTDRAGVMALSTEHALALERSRGYADLEPRLVWEQWQLVRGQY